MTFKNRRRAVCIAAAALTAVVLTAGVRARLMAETLPQAKSAPVAARVGNHWDYRGLIHWHTHYSKDCTGTYAGIGRIANLQHVDFMIATEHNTLKAQADGREGVYGRTLMLTGVEVTRPHPPARRNSYMLAVNIRRYDEEKSSGTRDILSSIKAQGGLAFIAHPKNPRWAWRGDVNKRLDGMEILDVSDAWFTASAGDVARAAFYYPFSARLALLQLIHREDDTLSLWDAITKTRRFTGIYAPDFHQAVHFPFHVVWRFPKAADVMPLAHDHIVTQEEMNGHFAHDKSLVYEALRGGHVYVALDGLADATGFMFAASSGTGAAWMGDGLTLQGAAQFTVSVPKPAPALENVQCIVFRNGTEVARFAGGGVHRFTQKQAGTYRIEVRAAMKTFFGAAREMTWIYSNPIYVSG